MGAFCSCFAMEDDGKSGGPKLPITGKRNILITTALPYINNNVSHLGNMIGTALSADVYARYCRLRDYNAISISETDEYGSKALEVDFCTYEEFFTIYKPFYDWFDICFDEFEWEQWWKNRENVELYQFVGRENVMSPATQLVTGENWALTKTISVNEGGEVFGSDLRDTNVPVEVWRYFLLRNKPGVVDTWGFLQAKLNGELLNNLGNFVNRVLKFVAKPENVGGYGFVIPDAPGAESHVLTMSMAEKVGKLVEEYVVAMENVKIKEGLKFAMFISSEGNKYLQESEFWRLYKEDKASCAIVIRSAVGLVHLLAILLEPFMPSFSREVFKQLNLPLRFSLYDERGEVVQASRPWMILPLSHRIGTPQPLFKKLEDEEVQQYYEQKGSDLPDKCVRDTVASRRSARRKASCIRRRRHQEEQEQAAAEKL